jgi:hypothetical protein
MDDDQRKAHRSHQLHAWLFAWKAERAQRGRPTTITSLVSERGCKPSYATHINNLLNQRGSFGERTARNLEQNLGMPDLFLDQDAAPDTAAVATPSVGASLDALQARLASLPPHAWAEVADTLRLWAGSGGKKYRGAVQEALEPEVLDSVGFLPVAVHGSTKETLPAAEARATKRTSSRKPIRKAA